MKRIGLTGSIGAGKSTVSTRLQQLGAYIIDADRASKEVVLPGTVGLKRIAEAFGEGVLEETGALNRKKMGEIVFADEEARKTLNHIVHPLVREWYQKQEAHILSQDPNAIIIYDVPLLIEGGMYRRMDAVWVVIADDDIRLGRILERDGCTKEHALLRMQSQMPQEEKVKYADAVIDNSNGLEALYHTVDALYHSCRS